VSAPSPALAHGEERVPPGVRTAAAVRWAMIALLAISAAGAWWRWATAGVAGAEVHGAAFRCPMHPAVVQDGPGSCPICKMDLVRAARAADAPDAAPGGPAGLRAVRIEPERARRAGIRTAVAARERVAARVRAAGHVAVDRSRVAVVSARFTGWVKEVRVGQTGQRVEKGQVLATVYSPDLVTAQQAYVNALQWAGRDGAKRGGRAGGAIDDEGRKRLELLGVAPQDIAAIARAGRPRLAVPLRAPVAGYVARSDALPGAPVQPGTDLFEVDDLSTVWVVAELSEGDARRVRVGDAARVEIGGEALAARVQLVAPSVREETRTVEARLAVANPDLRLRPGAYGEVTIDVAPAAGVAVPRDALVDTGDERYVFVARAGGRFEPRAVRPGARDAEKVIVLDGLAEGEAVVTAAAFLVDSESRLRAAAVSSASAAAHGEAQAMASGAAAER
jgi:membrane fusion protein, copper/silver efflux system